MILHISFADKFIPPYIKFINDNFNPDDHLFFVVNKGNRFQFESSKNLIHKRSFGIFNFLKLLSLYKKADKVILHGLFRDAIVFLLALNSSDLQKCYWVIWGGDLYHYHKRHKNLKNKFWHLMRRFVISRIGHLMTYIPVDYLFAQKWYDAKGEYSETFSYLSNVFHPISNTQSSLDPSFKHILLGNSSTPASRHEDAFYKLMRFKGKIKIISPLSYGNSKYKKKIIKRGHDFFQNDFIPLTDFMPLDEYHQILAGVDIVIFNHKRQQGMGNLIQLLGHGKKVFLNPSTPQYYLFESMGVKVFDINHIDLEPLDEETKINNQRIIAQYFSLENLKGQLTTIFNSPIYKNE